MEYKNIQSIIGELEKVNDRIKDAIEHLDCYDKVEESSRIWIEDEDSEEESYDEYEIFISIEKLVR